MPDTAIDNPDIERALQDVVAIHEKRFPDRIRAYYLHGSYLKGSAVAGSDLDVMIIFKGRFRKPELKKARAVFDECQNISPVYLGLTIHEESSILRLGYPSLKGEMRLLHGDDIRAQAPEMHEGFRHLLVHQYFMSASIARRQPRLTMPLDYPDPDDEFRGYAGNFNPRDPNQMAPLINCTVQAAKGMVKSRNYVDDLDVDKALCIRLYREMFDDDWANYLDELNRVCREQWSLRIPDAPEERARLTALCERALDFENHAMTFYKDFLLEEMRAEDRDSPWLTALELLRRGFPKMALRFRWLLKDIKARSEHGVTALQVRGLHKILAMMALTRIHYPDPAVSSALQAQLRSPSLLIRRVAKHALAANQTAAD